MKGDMYDEMPQIIKLKKKKSRAKSGKPQARESPRPWSRISTENRFILSGESPTPWTPDPGKAIKINLDNVNT